MKWAPINLRKPRAEVPQAGSLQAASQQPGRQPGSQAGNRTGLVFIVKTTVFENCWKCMVVLCRSFKTLLQKVDVSLEVCGPRCDFTRRF